MYRDTVNIIVSCVLCRQSVPFIKYKGRRKREGAECSVTVIARVYRKINLTRSRSIQKSDVSKEEVDLESLGTYSQTFA